jgi:tetratricopeptide (TPR) repeat protein
MTTSADAVPAASAAPTTAPTLPTSGASPTAEKLAENLLKEATLLREKGDTTNALARLQDASQRDPKNASVLAEMAMIYESIQLFDRSNETWRKIHDMGPAAGNLYELADMKLKVGAQPTAAPVTAAAAGPGFAGVSPLDAGTNRGGADGLPDGSTFGITEAAVTNNPDPDAETNLTLRVGVKVRPNTLIDHTKVKIQVYFYDTIDNNKVALTDADVSYEWLTPNHDWKGTNPEVLAVSYVRLKNGAISSDAALSEAAAAVTPGKKGSAAKKPAADGATRKYAGYQVRVYYNDQLQDVRAEPTKLLNLFPPPLTLPTQ